MNDSRSITRATKASTRGLPSDLRRRPHDTWLYGPWTKLSVKTCLGSTALKHHLVETATVQLMTCPWWQWWRGWWRRLSYVEVDRASTAARRRLRKSLNSAAPWASPTRCRNMAGVMMHSARPFIGNRADTSTSSWLWCTRSQVTTSERVHWRGSTTFTNRTVLLWRAVDIGNARAPCLSKPW